MIKSKCEKCQQTILLSNNYKDFPDVMHLCFKCTQQIGVGVPFEEIDLGNGNSMIAHNGVKK